MQKKFACTAVVIFSLVFAQAQPLTTISGTVNNQHADSIKLILQFTSITRKSKIYHIPLKNGHFSQTFTISEPTYLYTTEGTNYVFGWMDPGDRLSFSYDAADLKGSLRFEGKGKEKFEFMHLYSNLEFYKKLPAQKNIAATKKYPFDYLLDYADSVEIVYRQKLAAIQPAMSKQSYRLLSASLTADLLSTKYHSITTIYSESVDRTLEKRQDELTPRSRKVLGNLMMFDSTLSFSESYIQTVFSMLLWQYSALVNDHKAENELNKRFEYMQGNLPSSLKIPVLTLFIENTIINKMNRSEDIEGLIFKLYTSPKDSAYKNYVTRRFNDANSFKTGMNAPDFVLENEKGEKVTLASLKGKVVFLDFWYEACGPCHALFQNIAQIKEKYKKDSIVFLTISIDSKEVWFKALKKYKISGYHVFTENREGSHPIVQAYKVNGYPFTFLIDKNGKVFLATPSNNPDILSTQIAAALTAETN